MGLFKKIINTGKKVVSKVADVASDAGKLAVNTVVPVSNPFKADDFKTDFGRTGSKIQGFTDKASVAVVGAVLTKEAAKKMAATNEAKKGFAADLQPITEKSVSNIDETGLIPNGVVEIPNSKIVAPVVAPTQNSMLGNLFKTDSLGGSILGKVLTTVLPNVMPAAVSQQKVEQARETATNTLQKAQAAATTGQNLLSIGVGNIPPPPPEKLPWYKQTVTYIAAGVVFLVVVIALLFKRKRR